MNAGSQVAFGKVQSTPFGKVVGCTKNYGQVVAGIWESACGKPFARAISLEKETT